MRYWCWRPGPLQSWRNHGLPCRIWPFPGKDLLGKPDSQTDSLQANDSGEELSDKASFWFDMHSGGEEGQGVGADTENQDQHGQWIQAANTERMPPWELLSLAPSWHSAASPHLKCFFNFHRNSAFQPPIPNGFVDKKHLKNMIIKAQTSKTLGVCNSLQTGFREIGKACLVLSLFEHTGSENVYDSRAYTLGIRTH